MTEILRSPATFAAGADLSGNQHRFVKLDTSANKQVLQAGAGEQTYGVQRDVPATATGSAVSVDFGGGRAVKLVVDGNASAIVPGDYLKSDANGKGVKSTADQENVGAIANDASTADGDIITATLLPPGFERSTA